MSGDIKCKDNPVDGNYELDVDVSPKMNNSEWIRIIDKIYNIYPYHREMI